MKIIKKRGFTLIEMMVVLAIFSLTMGIAYTALKLNDNYRDLVFTRIELYRQVKRAVDNFAAELERSQSSRWTIADSNPDSIRFQIPLVNSMDAQYNVGWGARNMNLDYLNFFIRYRINGTNLVRDILNATLSPVSGTEQIMATGVTDLQFNQASPGYVTMKIDVQKTTTPPSRPININLTLDSAVYLRN